MESPPTKADLCACSEAFFGLGGLAESPLTQRDVWGCDQLGQPRIRPPLSGRVCGKPAHLRGHTRSGCPTLTNHVIRNTLVKVGQAGLEAGSPLSGRVCGKSAHLSGWLRLEHRGQSGTGPTGSVVWAGLRKVSLGEARCLGRFAESQRGSEREPIR